ncbi:MAG: hypothetical protein ACRDHL_07640 [Candidatus Promineifilaceae bacterium]
MFDSHPARLATAAVALLVALGALTAGWAVARGDGRLLREAGLDAAEITPNADGETDATAIRYELERNATVSIYFEDDQGERYYFRRQEPRGVGEYQVLFSGVVEGYRLPGESFEGEIQARLLRDGGYTWHIQAKDEVGVNESASGSLTISQAESLLPEIRNFSLDRRVFSPNQDGIDDRVLVQFFLPNEVANTRVFVLTPEGRELPIAELDRGVAENLPGRHYFDYEGGVDNQAAPPPDGAYPVIAIAEDAEGQRIRVEDELTIRIGGVPRAEIISPPVGDTLRLSATAVALCDTISFTLTLRNYGTAPLRTTGPEPGTTYDSDWNYNTLGWATESGAFRVAIGYENEITNYPYRWAIADREDLEQIGDHYYLMPGEQTEVTGSIRVTGPFGERNPQPMWAGLIHEDVAISAVNNRVDPHQVLVDLAKPENPATCPERAIPEAVGRPEPEG